ncbi:MAG: NAD(P)/FAD-dependent oxidoreductase [Pyrinomonadaceae bacterium]
MDLDVLIIGGGAAGLFCAIESSRRGRKTLLIEHGPRVGRKIIISGGGRCNFTNLGTAPENFISENPHFCRSALARYTPDDFVKLVRKHRIEYYEKKLGQLFCRDSSRRIVDMLLAECDRAGARIVTGCTVTRISRDRGFTVETSLGTFSAEKLVIATGGLSFPKIGASPFGYQIARQFGLEQVPTRPSLVALVRPKGEARSELAGISVDAEVTAEGHTFRENILFTHRGMSGPAILQVSNYWQKESPLHLDLMPELDVKDLLNSASGRAVQVSNFLTGYLPARFVETLPEKALLGRRLNSLSDREIDRLSEMLHDWHVKFVDTEGYGRAEVTLGGVSTRELSSQTMESRKVPGLYFIGEVVDVTGWLGGYNFQWAWASGFAAGNAV